MFTLPAKTLTLAACVSIVLSFGHAREISQGTNPRVVVSEQPGSPLLILPTGVDASDPLQPLYWYSLTNTSDKAVRAYTILQAGSRGLRSPIEGSTLSHMPAAKLLLAPHGSKQESGGHGRIYQEAPDKIILSVDFVEFADGSRWGNDTSRSGDQLDGNRAGGKAAIMKYRQILTTEGIEALEQALANSSLIQPQDSNKSDRWKFGFEWGVNIVRSGIGKQRTKDGINGIRRELDKPFDSTEGRQEP